MPRPTFREALAVWWRLGWISFGGTAAHIAQLHRAVVEEKGWVSDEEFLHALSHCMLLPGPEAQQLAIYLGWRLHGVPGGIAAGSLFVLPSMCVLLVLAIAYTLYGRVRVTAGAIEGLRAGVVALVALAIARVASKALRKPIQWVVAAGSFVALAWAHVTPALVMAAVIVIGLLAGRGASQTAASDAVEPTRGPASWRPLIMRTLRIVATGVVLWLLPLIAMRWLGRDFPFWRQLTVFFTEAAFVTFGGAYTVLPYVGQIAVQRFHWLSAGEMVDGFSLGETTPGPLIMVVTFVGFMAGLHHFNGSVAMASLALIATTYYTFLPCFVMVLAGAPLVQRTREWSAAQPVLELLPPVVIAAMSTLVLFLAATALFANGDVLRHHLAVFPLVWIVVSLLLLRFTRIGGIGLMACSVLAGIAHALWF